VSNIQEHLKLQATEIIRSHGAFGESERYEQVNPDTLIRVTAETCIEVIREVLREEGSAVSYEAADQIQRRIRQTFNLKEY
jgi:NTP pyrophosphatase (non-canonical NTP hydrolase)